MMERLIGKNLTVTCNDGSNHEGVELWLKDGKRIYKALNGTKLCVELTKAGTFYVSPIVYARAVCRCPIEVN